MNFELLPYMDRGYVIDHCIASFKVKKREEAYKTYITDCLRLISESTAKFGGGKYMSARFADLVDWGDRKKKEPEQDPEEIKRKIIEKLGGGNSG